MFYYFAAFPSSVSYNDEGDFSGDLSIGEWNSNVTGHYKPVGSSEYELSALSLERVSNLSLNMQIKPKKSYILAAEFTGPKCPFILKG